MFRLNNCCSTLSYDQNEHNFFSQTTTYIILAINITKWLIMMALYIDTTTVSMYNNGKGNV